MRALDAQIREAESKVLSAETSPALKKVLPRARRIVEQHQKEKDDVILKRWRDRRNNAAAIKKYRERITKDVTDISKLIDMLDAYKEGTLNYTPVCPYELLEAQAHAMKVYLGLLKLRADVEGIDFDEACL